jgi:hypothetical protein
MNISDLALITEKLKTDKSSKARKSKVKTYDSIKAALSDGYYGQIFTTKNAGRLYVVSKGKWGRKSGRSKIAKGFTPGSATPSATFKSIKAFAARTLVRHGKDPSKRLRKKYLEKKDK